jgi:hypothetical protein
MDLSAGPLILADGRAGVPFLLAMIVGSIVALGVPLLRRWPPTPLRWTLFGGVLAIGAAALVMVLVDRQVAVDPAAREVRESRRLLGIGRLERWPFSAFQVVQVEYRPLSVQRRSTQPAKPSDPEVRDRFVVELVGRDASVELQDFDEALRAEDFARGMAGIGGWSARRRGYELQRGSGRPGEVLTVGHAQAFETADGRSGVGVTLEPWVRVTIREGAESALDAAP